MSHKEKFSVFDRLESKWLIRSSRDVDYGFCFNGVDFTNFEEQCDTNVDASSSDRLLLCGNFTILMQEPNLIQATLESQLMYDKFDLPKIDMIVGVPGCGKTTFILREHKQGDLVLTSSSEGATDIRERLSKVLSKPVNELRENYRTIDSYLPNSRKEYNEVWIDEALMKHPGELFLVCLYTKCKTLHLLGDPNQIINRVTSIESVRCRFSTETLRNTSNHQGRSEYRTGVP